MTVKLNTTEHDHIPEDFTLESLMASGLTEAEVQVLTQGDDPIVAAAPQEPDLTPAVVTPPVEPQQPAAPAPVAEQPPALAQVPDTTQAQQHLEALKNEQAQIRERYDSGELAPEEFDAELERITAARAQAAAAIQHAQQIQQANRATIEQQWFSTLDSYHKTPGFDVLTSPQHLEGWDAALRSVSGHPQFSQLPMIKQMELAHQTYAATWNTLNPDNPIPVPAQRPAPKPQDPVQVNGLTGPRTDPRPDPVVTLSALPAAGQDAVSDGTFAALDRITDPLEHEKAFARLSPDMQAAYLASV